MLIRQHIFHVIKVWSVSRKPFLGYLMLTAYDMVVCNGLEDVSNTAAFLLCRIGQVAMFFISLSHK